MLQHREQEQSTHVPQVHPFTAPAPEVQATPLKKSKWRALYEEYVTNNPVYWKESQRPDLSALSPKLRAKTLENREKREAKAIPAWRQLLESLLGVGLLMTCIWGISSLFHNVKMPLFALYFSPFFGTLGMGAALTRNIILEREKRTWDALLLSHLTPAQILLGKLLPWLRQIAWVVVSMLVFVVPGLWDGSVPWISLAIAVPLVLTSPLPGGLFALETGLHARSMESGMKRTNKLILLPLLANMTAAGLGVLGILALQRREYNPLPLWLAILLVVPWLMMFVNLTWTRGLWRRLLRNFHKAPTDFSG